MVNIEDFIKRLEIILDYYGINASAFADKIGVQRSSLSHLLSGRNKPSLDFVLKILDVYPDVDLYWILNGKGSFPKNAISDTEKKIPHAPINHTIPNGLFDEEKNESVVQIQDKRETEMKTIKKTNEAEIDKIVIFYKDGTFKSYVP
ncbi:transcriptional regulator with XRE-family HTH domain [Flavobacterium sp. 28A]|uniref:helix-turn-helix domain-containing protein n=1 Tax=Flavobacterium sp. 28A TaxID=2735895 RepID=UPI00156E5669|nr:helix-turn-helix transcriptional regulator [Flavobacterium sp. 28A]NRT14837.1 transcriptional regulator with XRE-family HTH domain [Flavobacterium sp. 28A]